MPASPQRGEVCWLRLDPAQGSEIQKTRPCVVLSSDILNVHRRTVVVVPLSTAPHESPPLLIGLRSVGKPAVAVLDQLRAVTKERLQEKLGVLATTELHALEDALREILEL